MKFYKIGKMLGKGAFGKVNLGIHKLTGQFVAIKSIDKQLMKDDHSKNKVKVKLLSGNNSAILV